MFDKFLKLCWICGTIDRKYLQERKCKLWFEIELKKMTVSILSKKKKTFLSKIRGFVILRLFSCKFSYLKFSFSEKATKIWEKSSTCNAATEKWDIGFKFYGLLTMSELKKLPMIYIDTRNFGIVFTSILMQESKISTEIRSGKK